jgi:hypothetical protein
LIREGEERGERGERGEREEREEKSESTIRVLDLINKSDLNAILLFEILKRFFQIWQEVFKICGHKYSRRKFVGHGRMEKEKEEEENGLKKGCFDEGVLPFLS